MKEAEVKLTITFDKDPSYVNTAIIPAEWATAFREQVWVIMKSFMIPLKKQQEPRSDRVMAFGIALAAHNHTQYKEEKKRKMAESWTNAIKNYLQSEAGKKELPSLIDSELLNELLQYEPPNYKPMEEKKYYNPGILRLNTGDEFEIELYSNFNNINENNGFKWYKCTVGAVTETYNTYTIVDLVKYNKPIRVPYLTPEQIVAEGWTKTWENYKRAFNKQTEDCYCMLNMGKYDVASGTRDNSTFIDIIKIKNKNIRDGKPESVFSGECKSINELRTISKLLNIK